MTGRLLPREALDPADEAAMYELLRTQFTGLSRDRFQADLENKDWVLLLYDVGSRLCALSTFALYDTRFRGRELSVVCSGDTVAAPSSWRRQMLSRYWIGAVNHIRRTTGRDRLCWLLIVSGYRTYRFLPVYWREFYPRYDCETPGETQAMMEGLTRDRYGASYLRDQGIVRFDSPQILNGSFRGIPPRRLRDPHVAFFAARNPGHETGDELVCFVELDEHNLTPAGARMWAAGNALFADAAVPA